MHPNEQRIDLKGNGWQFAFAESAVSSTMASLSDLQNAGLTLRPCTVPGNFELDLQAVGLAPEPFFGMNIADLRGYENTHVWYGRTFDAPIPSGDFEPVLVFEGIDCYADIFLNGQKIGDSDNMLIVQEFPIPPGLLRPDAENELFVHLRPVTVEAGNYPYPPGVAAGRNRMDSLYVRKAPHMYGWDIMPRALSAGLWRPVSLYFRPARARLETVYLETLLATPQSARQTLYFSAHLPDADFVQDRYEIDIEGICGESRFSRREWIHFQTGNIPFTIANPHLWWPRGRGDASLYDVTVRLLRNGDPVDEVRFRHGIRTVALERTSVTDSEGRGEFCFRINGEKVFMLGTNWVPLDAYHSRDHARIPQALALAEEIGCNMLRCWGGNVYEDDLFYDLCDEKGFLIWQDFAMACAVYPQDDTFAARIRTEAEHIVRRLRQHPCLALWSGDNECDQASGWHDRGDPNRNRLTREVLPTVLRAEDRRRPFLPSSPYIDAETYRAGASFATEDHLWGPRDYFKSRYYTGSLCHFVSEIGYHGCPSPESIRRFISPNKLWPPQGNDEWLLHATSPIPGAGIHDSRIPLMLNQVREFFGTVPDDLENFAFASQCVQAEAKKFFIELFRSQKWRRTGILWWNLIDGWPQFSDAVVDYYFNRKLAFDSIRRAQQPITLILREPNAWKQELVVSNDRRESIPISFRIFDIDTDETLLTGEGTARGDAVTSLGTIPHFASDKRFLILEWTAQDGSGATGRSHYLVGHPPFDLSTYRRWWKEAFASG